MKCRHSTVRVLACSTGLTLMLLGAFSAQAATPQSETTPTLDTTTPHALRLQLSAHEHTTLSSELSGKLKQVRVEEGDHFEKGDTLLTFDCAIHQARLRRSNAAERAAQEKLAIAQQLNQLNSISMTDVAQAEADQQMAEAESGIHRVMVNRCQVEAPFNGRVAERLVQPGEYVSEGTELLALYADDRFDVELIAPSQWLRWLEPGLPFTVTLDETGQSYQATLTRLGAIVDPVSQSIKLMGQITPDVSSETDGSDDQTANHRTPAKLLPGMSGTAHFDHPSQDQDLSAATALTTDMLTDIQSSTDSFNPSVP